jgi:hypothetical protein
MFRKAIWAVGLLTLLGLSAYLLKGFLHAPAGSDAPPARAVFVLDDTGEPSGSVVIRYDLSSGQPISRPLGLYADMVVSPDGTKLYAVFANGGAQQVQLVELNADTLDIQRKISLSSIDGDIRRGRPMAISPEGRLLYVRDVHQQLKVFDTTTLTIVGEMKEVCPRGLLLPGPAERMITLCGKGELMVQSANAKEVQRQRLDLPESETNWAALVGAVLDRSGQVLYAITRSGALYGHDLTKNRTKLLLELKFAGDPGRAVAVGGLRFSGDGTLLIIGAGSPESRASGRVDELIYVAIAGGRTERRIALAEPIDAGFAVVRQNGQIISVAGPFTGEKRLVAFDERGVQVRQFPERIRVPRVIAIGP